MAEKKTAKNSPLRILTAPFRGAAEWLESSGVQANTVTVTGVGLTIAGGSLAMARNLYPELGFAHGLPEALSVMGGVADAADGMVAGVENEHGRSPAEQLNGKLLDVSGDRIGALALALMRAETARQRGDWIGKYAALANGIMQNFPSLVRAAAEMKGRTVSELDLGSYPVRWVLSFLGTHFPTEGGYEIQKYTDIASTALAAFTTAVRLHSLMFGKGDKISDNEALEAPAKFSRLLALTTLSVIAVVGYEVITDGEALAKTF